MHRHDARPNLGEVIAPEEEKKRSGAYRDGQRDRHEDPTTGDRLFKQRTVALAELIESAFESFLKADKDVAR
ncbi:MAG: hypothetical protein NPIRA04_08570 [Nitrospirales bacterium]|nr:MAG: hypothetical protein NPIRA04_08570 [Nitrospirales bacterium]